MKINPIVIVAGEPYSIFFEIFFKSLKEKRIKKLKNPIIIICSKDLLMKQMNKLGYQFNIREISIKKLNYLKIKNDKINIINVDFKFKKIFDKISFKSNLYLKNCFETALSLMKRYKIKVLINGPVSKKYFLKKKYPGMTEFFAKKTKCLGKEVMLIFNNKLAVSPLTTHLPLKKVVKKISRKKLINQAIAINYFYKSNFNLKPQIGVTGLNPHCETIDTISEEDKILKPAIFKLKSLGLKISGPYPADTLFLKNNLKNYDVIIGMYHDQVLTPIKTLYGFDAINITLGLPFLRITPDHGTNNKMIGKNLSSPKSLIESILFTKRLSDF